VKVRIFYLSTLRFLIHKKKVDKPGSGKEPLSAGESSYLLFVNLFLASANVNEMEQKDGKFLLVYLFLRIFDTGIKVVATTPLSETTIPKVEYKIPERSPLPFPAHSTLHKPTSM
jgi:hypothetical protein